MTDRERTTFILLELDELLLMLHELGRRRYTVEPELIRLLAIIADVPPACLHVAVVIHDLSPEIFDAMRHGALSLSEGWRELQRVAALNEWSNCRRVQSTEV